MSWVRVDDNAAFHGKILAAGNEAVGVWIRCLAWSNANLTDGLVPRQLALVITNGSTEPIDRLVESRLFEKHGDDFLIHDFAEYQMTAAEVKAKRADIRDKRSKAGKAGARARWQNGKRKAKGSNLPNGKIGKPAGGNSEGPPTGTNNEKSTVYDSKNSKTIANAKQNNSPIPSHPIPLDIQDDRQFESAEIEELATPQLGRLGGRAMGNLVRLAPLFGWEIKAGLAAGSPNWGYFVKVVESTREEMSKPKPPRGQKRQPPQPPSDFGRAAPSKDFGDGDQRI